MPLKLRSFIYALLDLLREDYPLQLHELIRDARGITCLQTLDDETIIIKIRRGKIKIVRRVRKKEINIRVSLSRRCLFRILEGELTLEEAFYTDELKVCGDPLTLLRTYQLWQKIISLSRKSPRFYFLTYKLR